MLSRKGKGVQTVASMLREHVRKRLASISHFQSSIIPHTRFRFFVTKTDVFEINGDFATLPEPDKDVRIRKDLLIVIICNSPGFVSKEAFNYIMI